VSELISTSVAASIVTEEFKEPSLIVSLDSISNSSVFTNCQLYPSPSWNLSSSRTRSVIAIFSFTEAKSAIVANGFIAVGALAFSNASNIS